MGDITSGKWYVLESQQVDGQYHIMANDGEREYKNVCQLATRPEAKANALAIAQLPRLMELLEAIEAYQRDGLNRWDWIQSEVNSVLAEIRGK